jgi:hypothetical protein
LSDLEAALEVEPKDAAIVNEISSVRAQTAAAVAAEKEIAVAAMSLRKAPALEAVVPVPRDEDSGRTFVFLNNSLVRIFPHMFTPLFTAILFCPPLFCQLSDFVLFYIADRTRSSTILNSK